MMRSAPPSADETTIQEGFLSRMVTATFRRKIATATAAVVLILVGCAEKESAAQINRIATVASVQDDLSEQASITGVIGWSSATNCLVVNHDGNETVLALSENASVQEQVIRLESGQKIAIDGAPIELGGEYVSSQRLTSNNSCLDDPDDDIFHVVSF